MNGKTMIANRYSRCERSSEFENGLLVPAEDPQALAQAIKQLAGDPEKEPL